MGKSRSNLTSTPRTVVIAADPSVSSEPSTTGRAHLEACYAADSAAGSRAGTTSRYLCYFLHRLLDFRIPELQALADMFGVKDVRWEMPVDGIEVSPFWYVHLPSARVAQQIVDRAVLMRGIFEVWGEGSTFAEMQEAVEAYPAELKAPYMGPDCSFMVMLDAWGHTWDAQQQKQLFKDLEFIPFEGKVDLKQPQQTFWLCCQKKTEHNGLPDMPTRWFFLRQVALADRSWVKEYALSRRAYIGPTSMDTEMAFLMTNMAQVTRHSLVLDPYVGTGSILIAAAARGAYTMGADIDVRVLKHGNINKKTGKAVDIYSNYDQYGLPWPVGLVRMDVHTHPFRTGLGEVFGAIMGDPPYGVRAGGRKLVPKDHLVRYPSTHIPSTEPYSLTECLADLLEFAAVTLVTGGRLVFFMPSSPDTYKEDQLPSHPMLEIVANTEQLLTGRYTRRLITMKKVRPYDADIVARFKAERADFVMDIDRLHEIVYAQEPGKGDNGLVGEQRVDAASADGDGVDGITKVPKPKYRSKVL